MMICLEDEVREGFFIPTMMKRNWACLLDLLEQIDGICRAYNIRYYPAFGTLLGVVRHKGFVPWDDDIDIMMTRDEFEHFYEIAKSQLPAPYRVCHIAEKEYTDRSVTKITGEAKIILEENYLRDHYGFPYPIVIDVFLLDGVCADAEEEKKKKDRLLEIEEIIFQEPDAEKRFALATERDVLYKSCPADKAERVAIHFMEGFSYVFQKKWFDDTIVMPFEHLNLPVPKDYHKILNVFYIDYSVKLRAVSSHEYPVYLKQEKVLCDALNKNPYRYTFSTDDMSKPCVPSRRERVEEMSATLQKVSKMAEQLVASGDGEKAVQVLHSSMKLADALEMELARPAEVLFLPLKASWWDTMEPLYRKIRGLGNVNVHVMPLSWQNVNSDGTTEGIWHSEADRFPEMSGLIEEGSYDPEHKRPDLVVIQFPFDGWSTATAIPSQYHSSALREKVGCILYIPPFKTDDPYPDDKALAASLRILVEQPAVFFSDYTLLPSKAMRDFYLETLGDIVGEETRDLWNRRLIISVEEPLKEILIKKE